MFWSQPKPWAKIIGCPSARPETFTLFRTRTSATEPRYSAGDGLPSPWLRSRAGWSSLEGGRGGVAGTPAMHRSRRGSEGLPPAPETVERPVGFEGQALDEMDERARLRLGAERNGVHDGLHDGDATPSRRQRTGHGPVERHRVEAVPGVLHPDGALLVIDLEANLVFVAGGGVVDDVAARFAQPERDVADAFRRHAEHGQRVLDDRPDQRDRLGFLGQADRHVEEHGTFLSVGLGDTPRIGRRRALHDPRGPGRRRPPRSRPAALQLLPMPRRLLPVDPRSKPAVRAGRPAPGTGRDGIRGVLLGPRPP